MQSSKHELDILRLEERSITVYREVQPEKTSHPPAPKSLTLFGITILFKEVHNSQLFEGFPEE